MNAEKPVPKTKQQLISMLKQQLEQVQDDINAMQTTLEQEREKRKELKAQLEEKQQKIQTLIENQAKTLGDKVNEGLFNTLQAANKIRAEAESQGRKLVEDNIAINEKIINKDNKTADDRKTVELNFKKIATLEQKKTDLTRKQVALVEKKKEVAKNLEMMKKEYQRIERQEQQLRNHIENAKKLRLYLNKHLEGNLKQQNIAPLGTKKSSTPADSFWN